MYSRLSVNSEDTDRDSNQRPVIFVEESGSPESNQTSSPIQINQSTPVDIWPRSWAQIIDTTLSPGSLKNQTRTLHADHGDTTPSASQPIFARRSGASQQWPKSWKAATDATSIPNSISKFSLTSSRRRLEGTAHGGISASLGRSYLAEQDTSMEDDGLTSLLIYQPADSLYDGDENDQNLMNTEAKDGYVKQPPKYEDEKEKFVELPPEGSSMLATILNGMNILCGIGMLATPYAVAVSGTGSLLVVCILAIACCFTGVLLRNCMDICGPWCQAYPDIGLAAFGKKGRILVAIMLCLELLSCSVEVIILGGQNLAQLTGNWYLTFGGLISSPEIFWYIATGIILLPLAWIQNIKWLSLASSGGILSSLTIMSLIFALGVKETSFDQLPGNFLQWQGILVAIGLYCFCFSGHSVFPNLYRSLQIPQKFNATLMIVFACVTLLYVAMGLIGFNTFGANVQQQITMSMSVQYPDAVTSKIAAWLVMVNPFTSYPLFLSPVAMVLEELLPANQRGAKFLLSSLFIRTCLVLFTVLIAISVPFFAYFGSLVGSVLSVSISYILPCLFYVKITKTANIKVGKLVSVLCVVVPIIGVLVGAAGTYQSILAILNSNK